MDANDGVLILTPVVYACAHCGAIIPGGKKYRLCDSCVSRIRRDSGSNIARVLYLANEKRKTMIKNRFIKVLAEPRLRSLQSRIAPVLMQ